MHHDITKFLFLASLIATSVWSCTPNDEVISTDPGIEVTFSVDTVKFDTILTEVQSITRRVRIFNPDENAIKIDQIGLATANSPFLLTINGEQGDRFTDVPVLGNDSLLVLVEATIDQRDEANPYIVKDSIIIDYNTRSKDIKLLAWGQDANYLDETILEENTTWTAGKPYVITSIVLVDSLVNLNIDPGARVLFEPLAGLFVQGTLRALGTVENPILFSNTRFDEDFEDAPGQWDGIYILEGSKNNVVRHATVRNGSIGFRIGSPDDDSEFDIEIENTIIQNMSVAGIQAFTSDVAATNTLIHNCGSYLIGNFAGGNYQYEHCTFTNFPSSLFREDPSVQFSDNVLLDNNQILAAPLSVKIENSIIWGLEQEEIALDDREGLVISFNLTNNILRSTNATFDVNTNILSQEANYPGFVAELGQDYRLDSLANARDIALPSDITNDLLENVRDSLPDIGAYEWIPSQP
ncbi:MAG: right-handed parallel beta-helix repeat-containing protein [Bacteroidota bacterium]